MNVFVGIPEVPTLRLTRNVTLSGEAIFFFSLSPPTNINEIDLESYEITVIDSNVTLLLTNETTEFILSLPLTGVSAEIAVVAVDRCKQRSLAASLIGTYVILFCYYDHSF